ncbi:hypothetical protein [Pontibacter akesuensis]|uniref:DUF3221 domain-containing protein n=1 Tax=Pontibacter akesuensis TaxID=388950 RepID=A0A1I7KSN8_9BACT|nr:hypothetical protein [Pontibacter akesuensis]SFV00415.1 hypothetical protein SAMN04487941_4053 [Pontibacter akesuensis]
MKHVRQGMVSVAVLALLWLTGCKASTPPADSSDTETTAYRSSAPQRVDIRGTIVTSRYDQGQVMLEVENYTPSPESRYNRAYVLVLPTAQIVDPEGRTISLSELRQGQNVAILMRGNGQGNFVGMGIARKIWLEEAF